MNILWNECRSCTSVDMINLEILGGRIGLIKPKFIQVLSALQQGSMGQSFTPPSTLHPPPPLSFSKVLGIPTPSFLLKGHRFQEVGMSGMVPGNPLLNITIPDKQQLDMITMPAMGEEPLF